MAAVKHVRMKSQPGALTLEVDSRNKVLLANRTEKEVSETANAMFEIAKLGSDEIHPDDKKGLMGNKLYVGCLLFGLFKSTYSLRVDLTQAKEGALMAMDSCAYRYSNAVAESFPISSFERFYTLDLSLWPVGFITICTVELPRFIDYIAALSRGLSTRAREIVEAYPLLFAHD